ncbi:MAG: hypothetical protein Q8P67_06855, partial [archaeon]|nr:hypothetical protein [archaeon]
MAATSLEDDDGVMVPDFLVLEREAFPYTRNYCEENVYRFVEELLPRLPAEAQCFVVFISNPNGTIPIWNHRAEGIEDGSDESVGSDSETGILSCSSSGSSAGGIGEAEGAYGNGLDDDEDEGDEGGFGGDGDAVIIWDYHVICVVKPRRGDCVAWIFDFDSDMDFPSPAPEYAVWCLGIQYELPKKYQHRFRMVQAKSFLDSFASDRRHMIDDETGKLSSPPPPFPPIRGPLSKEAHNLPLYMNTHLL